MPCANPDAQRASVRQAVAKLRASRRALAIAYLGGVCAICGGTDRLEFHHRDERTKVNNVSRLWTRRPEVVWAEIDKTELLCHQCHFEVTNYGDKRKGNV